jgi:hypothetical protein
MSKKSAKTGKKNHALGMIFFRKINSGRPVDIDRGFVLT